jgi:hypothetical protein
MNMYLELDDETRIPVSIYTHGTTLSISNTTLDNKTIIAIVHNPEIIFHSTALGITGFVAKPDLNSEGDSEYTLQTFCLRMEKK